MNRADPFFERDATGWQFINVANGHVDLNFNLVQQHRTRRCVSMPKSKQPEDTRYQAENSRIPPQSHY